MRAAGTAVLAAALALAAPPARAQAPGGTWSRATLEPGVARLGERVIYRGAVLVPTGTAFRWMLPAGGGIFEWGAPRFRRAPVFAGSGNGGAFADTFEIEVPFQAFATGVLDVPGLGYQTRTARGPIVESRLPTVALAIEPVVPAEDSTADLRPLRGPFTAPWWERFPWGLAAGAALALAGLVALARRLRRRPRRAAPEPAGAGRDPALEALTALEALRGLRLPEHGRFGEHAFHLTRILRRFLEATEGAPRPGDTTPELLAHLDRLGPPDLERLAALLAAWDR
ncbi:MAG TPA: hypothetical protein VMS88_08015, partial [Terriglobales bacterium]|nr:hypothetical protein [Terriglobales bacterium]